MTIQTKITHYSNSAAFEFVTPLTNRYFWNQEIILAQFGLRAMYIVHLLNLKEIHSIIIWNELVFKRREGEGQTNCQSF